jgi:hypothetical protein
MAGLTNFSVGEVAQGLATVGNSAATITSTVYNGKASLTLAQAELERAKNGIPTYQNGDLKIAGNGLDVTSIQKDQAVAEVEKAHAVTDSGNNFLIALIGLFFLLIFLLTKK